MEPSEAGEVRNAAGEGAVHGGDETEHISAASRQIFHCNVCQTSFTEKRSLRRHFQSKSHCQKIGVVVTVTICPHPDCGKSFTRADQRRRHEAEIHRNRKRGNGGQRTKRPVDATPMASRPLDQQQAVALRPDGLVDLTFLEESPTMTFVEPFDLIDWLEYPILLADPPAPSLPGSGVLDL